MNKTNLITFITEKPKDKLEAQKFFLSEYPGIIYIKETDSYSYRGIEFDYFKAGYPLDLNYDYGSTFILVDKDDFTLWLFNYGEKEDRWKDYLEHKTMKKKFKKVGFLNWFSSIICKKHDKNS